MEIIKQKAIRIANYYGEQFGAGYGGNIWDVGGCAPTLKTGASASQQMVIVYEVDN